MGCCVAGVGPSKRCYWHICGCQQPRPAPQRLSHQLKSKNSMVDGRGRRPGKLYLCLFVAYCKLPFYGICVTACHSATRPTRDVAGGWTLRFLREDRVSSAEGNVMTFFALSHASGQPLSCCHQSSIPLQSTDIASPIPVMCSPTVVTARRPRSRI